jgi:hypothetical protein
MAAGTALAQRTPEQDASGRQIMDASGHRVTYSTSAVQRPSATSTSRSTDRIIAGGGRKLSIQSLNTALLSATPSYTDLWRLPVWGTGLGLTGFWPVDVDGDGKLEFVTGGGRDFSQNYFWSIVGYDEARHDYQVRWQSPAGSYLLAEGITASRVVETAGTKHVWLGYYSGAIVVKDLITHADVAVPSPATGTINDMALADADNDGTLDVVVLTSTNLYIYNAATAALERTLSYGGDRLAIGNVDNDANLEIVLNSGKVLEVTSSSVTVERDGASFGLDVALADIDGDGRQELIASEGWYHIKAWDLEVPSMKWDHPVLADISALRLFDVTGDGVPEVLYGDGQWGGVHALSASTGDELWVVQNPEHGVTDIAVFDADHDGQLELIFGAGWSSTGPDHIYVHDLATRALEWKSLDYNGPFQAVDAGDVDGDGSTEIVAAPFNGASDYGGVVTVYDAITHQLKWLNPTSLPLSGNIGDLRVRNVDSDPQSEIILAAGHLYILDGLTHAVQLDRSYDGGANLQSVAVGDVDGDGKPEIVAGSENGSSATLYVINPANGDVIWQSPTLSPASLGIWSLRVADVGAPGTDILAIVDGFVYRWRWSDKQLLTTNTGNYRSLAIADALGTGQRQIVAARNTGEIVILDPDTLATLDTRSVCAGQVWAVEEHGPKQLAFTCGSSFGIYDVGTQSVVTQTDTKVDSLGQWGSIVSTSIGGKQAYLLGGFQAVEMLDVGGNNLPSISAGNYSVHWRGQVDVTLSGSDPDGDAVSFEVVGFPSKGTVTWLDRASGVLRYSVNDGSKGTDGLSVRAFDGVQYSSAKPIALTLTNTAPTAGTTALSFHWRGAQSAKLAGSDADGDPLKFSIGTSTGKGALTVTDAGTGAVQFVPSGAFVGSDSLTYQVSDGADASAPQSVQVTLTNTAPVAQASTYAITAGTTLSARVTAQDADSDPLTYEVVQQATKGTFTMESGTGLFQYVPANGGSGTDVVTVAVSDGVTRSQSATLEFRYPGGGDGGGKGGGGRLDWLTLVLLGAALAFQQAALRRRSFRRS